MRKRIIAVIMRPEFWLYALLFWTLLSAGRSTGTPWARAALTEALRWSAGIGLALALGMWVRGTKVAARCAVVIVGALAMLGLWGGLQPGYGGLTGPYREHQLYGSVLLVLLPVCVAAALSSHTAPWRLGAIAAVGAGLFCLFLSQTRSAWAGAFVAAVVFGGLWLSGSVLSRHQRRTWGLSAAALFGGLLLFWLLLTPPNLRVPLATRVGTLSALQTDDSWQERLALWHGTSRLVASHPFFGIGLGRYPGAQQAWTGSGRPLTPSERPSLSEEAHDFYLQTASEIGVVGLGLYGAALAAFIIQALQRLRQRQPRQSQDVLVIAALSMLAGQAVDAIASPSWQFAEASLFFWALLGLGLAAVRRQESERKPEIVTASKVMLPRRLGQWALSGLAAVALTANVLPIGLLTPVEAYTIPTGFSYYGYTLTPTSPTTVSLALGNTVTFTLKCLYKNNTNPSDIRSQDVSNEGPIAPTGTYFTVSGTSHTSTTTFFGSTSATRNTLTIDSRDLNKPLTCQAHFSNNGFNQPTSNFTVTLTP